MSKLSEKEARRNSLASVEFLKLKHSIKRCETLEQINGLKEVVMQHAEKNRHEQDIIVYWLNELGDIERATLDAMINARMSNTADSKLHSLNCGAHD